MSNLPEKRRRTVDEYFDMERETDVKHEYIDGEIVVVNEASPSHSVITVNVASSFNAQLAERDCTVYAGEMRVRANARSYFYPDVCVVCGEARIDESGSLETLLNPILIVEVLSPATEVYDRGTKLDVYRQIDSLHEFLLIAQDAPRIERYRRYTDGQWIYDNTAGLESALELPSIGCTLRLADVYGNVTFPAQDDATPGRE